MNAFWDLMNANGIPFADLDRYATRYGIEGVDEFERFKTLVRRLNSVWLNKIAPASAPDKGEEPSKPGRQPSTV